MDKVIRNTTFPRSLAPTQLDFFSEGIGIRVRKSATAKNYFGILLTLLAYAALGGAGWWYTMEFFDEKNPKIVVQNVIQNQANKLRAGSMGTQFFFLVGNPEATFAATDRTATPNDPSVSASADSTASPFGSSGATVTGTKNPYLSAAQLGSYFDLRVLKEVVGFVSDPATGMDTNTVDFVGYSLVPCASAGWFTAAAVQSRLQQNKYMHALVSKYGLCLDLPADTELFGDPLSKAHAYLRVSLSICNSAASTACLANAAVVVAAAPRLKIDFGAFEPVLEDQQKSSALRYSLNLKSSIDVSIMSQASVEVTMKKMQVETDNGWVWPDTTSTSAAVVDSLTRSYSPSFVWGPDITTLIAPPPAVSPNYVIQFQGSNADLVSITISSSRLFQSIKKIYPNIQDSLFKIGGSVECLVLVLLLLFHWTENLFRNSLIRSAAKEGLKIPESVCGSKYSLPTSQIFDELSEEALSLEQIVNLGTSQRFVMEATLSCEAKKLLPLAAFLKRSIQKKKVQNFPIIPHTPNQTTTGPKQELPSTILTAEGSKEAQNKLSTAIIQPVVPAQELAPKDAYDRLNRSEQLMNRQTTLLEQQILQTIHEFCHVYGVKDINEILINDYPPKSNQAQVAPVQTPQATSQNNNDLNASVNLMNQTASETTPLAGMPGAAQKPQGAAQKQTPVIVVSPPTRPGQLAPAALAGPSQRPPVAAEASKRVSFSPTGLSPGNIAIVDASQPSGGESPTYTRESPQAERSAATSMGQNAQTISRFEGNRAPFSGETTQEIPWSSENRTNLNRTAPTRELPQGETTQGVQPRRSWRDNALQSGEHPQQSSPTNRPRVFRTRAFYEAEAKRGTYPS